MRIVAVLFVIAAAGCSASETEAPAHPPKSSLRVEDAADPTTPEDEPAPPSMAEPVKPLPPRGSEARSGRYILGTTWLRLKASSERKVTVDGVARSNAIAALYRGERVDVLDENGDFFRVRVSDGTEGYIAASMIVSDARLATVVEETKTFRRPALVNLAKKTLSPGQLLFVVGQKNDFAEVNVAGSRTEWILSESLSESEELVGASRILHRVRALKADTKRDHGDEILTLIGVAKTNFPRSALIPTLVAEVDPLEAERLAKELGRGRPAATDRASYPLHGSTPSLAWSPDGRRLVVNAAYEYFGFDAEAERDADVLGIHVLDVARGTFTRVWDKPGHHPVWINGNQLAWGVSEYESYSNEAGLFIGNLDGAELTVRRVDDAKDSVLNTHSARAGGVLFFAENWTDEAAWKRYDPREDRVSQVVTASANTGESWRVPQKHVLSQCQQAVEGVVVSVDDDQVFVERNGEKKVLLEAPPMKFSPMAEGGCDNADRCKPVLPCVSPDGKHVALIRSTETRGVLSLELFTL